MVVLVKLYLFPSDINYLFYTVLRIRGEISLIYVKIMSYGKTYNDPHRLYCLHAKCNVLFYLFLSWIMAWTFCLFIITSELI